MKLLVSGLLNVETTVPVRGFPINYYPIDYPFFGIRSAVSGVGFNIAKALTTLGDQVELVSFLGRDEEGDRILRTLEQERIGADRILRELESTPVSTVLFDPAGRRQIYCDLKDIQDRRLDPETLRHALLACSAAVLCNINFNRPLLRIARELGILTATDVHVLGSVEDDYNREFMEQADVLFFSDENLPCPAEDFIRRLRDRYHNRVLVTGMGTKGALLLEENREPVHIPAWTGGPVVNTVGAGDALFSAFLHFYCREGVAEAALHRAVVFAAVKIGLHGSAQGFCTERQLAAVMEHGISAL